MHLLGRMIFPIHTTVAEDTAAAANLQVSYLHLFHFVIHARFFNENIKCYV